MRDNRQNQELKSGNNEASDKPAVEGLIELIEEHTGIMFGVDCIEVLRDPGSLAHDDHRRMSGSYWIAEIALKGLEESKLSPEEAANLISTAATAIESLTGKYIEEVGRDKAFEDHFEIIARGLDVSDRLATERVNAALSVAIQATARIQRAFERLLNDRT